MPDKIADLNRVELDEHFGQWKIFRVRIDKKDPNAKRVADNVKKSIDQPVNGEDLAANTYWLDQQYFNDQNI